MQKVEITPQSPILLHDLVIEIEASDVITDNKLRQLAARIREGVYTQKELEELALRFGVSFRTLLRAMRSAGLVLRVRKSNERFYVYTRGIDMHDLLAFISEKMQRRR